MNFFLLYLRYLSPKLGTYPKQKTVSVDFFPNSRWILLSFPEASNRIFTRGKSRLMIAFCWAIPFLIILPSLTGTWGKHGLDCKTRSCTIIDKDDGTLSFKKFLMTVGVVIPSAILIVIHLMIYEKVFFFIFSNQFCQNNQSSSAVS